MSLKLKRVIIRNPPLIFEDVESIKKFKAKMAEAFQCGIEHINVEYYEMERIIKVYEGGKI